MPDPEFLARLDIDEMLVEAGWVVQDMNEINLTLPGVAIREVSIPGAGEADYLLMAEGKAIGVIEAKARGTTLTGVETQTGNYALTLPPHIQSWRLPLPMLYESTGIETQFTNMLDPEPRSRRVFSFHRPQTLVAQVKTNLQGETVMSIGEEPGSYTSGDESLSGRFARLPATIADPSLWPAQREAIANVERSLKEFRPRSLVQMATGSGKTFTAISLIYRLIRHADAKRVLFLVDRANLGKQTFNEFQQFTTPDDGRKFTEIYNVQHLKSTHINESSRVVISTIQRVYSILSGVDMPEDADESSMFEPENQEREQKIVSYNPTVPIETFDIIVIDEAHRSIFNLWRQVLEYFDAYLIGLTATPNKQAFGFFNQNLVMEYTHEDAVRDNVNVPFDVYPIRTRITLEGSGVEAGYQLDYRDKKTREVRWRELDEDLTYTAEDLDRTVVTPDQIRTVIQTFRDKVFTEIFPNRSEVPKTLIFAKDDSHADDIVRITREEFGKGNDFCQKITYRTTGTRPEDLLSQFRNNYNPRIVVTVDMIATGTDVKPIEIVMFMRTVKSKGYFEQMKGRGVRVMPPDDLKRVTADAVAKTHFVIIDAVGVTESDLTDSPAPLERKRSVSFQKLMDQIAWGRTDRDVISSMAFRLSKLEKTLSPADEQHIAALNDGEGLHTIVSRLLAAADIDRQVERARASNELSSDEMPTDQQIEAARVELAREAIAPLQGNVPLRQALVSIQAKSEQVIDIISHDELVSAGFSAEATERQRKLTADFTAFIEANKDEITALQIIYNQPYGAGLEFDHLRELANLLEAPPRSWSVEKLWQAYAQLDKSKVRGSNKRVLTDLVSLIRHAMHVEPELVPFPEHVNQRFEDWLQAQESNGRVFTAEQRVWLENIRDHIGMSVRMSRDDFDNAPFSQLGGLGHMYDLFGDEYEAIVDELNRELAA